MLLLGKMQSDSGKLFIGGISWDTNEERLKEYFSAFGDVVEAVIMKDRTTGRARGFGFVVFAEPAVADTVIMEKHNIDGRMVIKILCFQSMYSYPSIVRLCSSHVRASLSFFV